jgi:hypothetical protein
MVIFDIAMLITSYLPEEEVTVERERSKRPNEWLTFSAPAHMTLGNIITAFAPPTRWVTCLLADKSREIELGQLNCLHHKYCDVPLATLRQRLAEQRSDWHIVFRKRQFAKKSK